MILVARFYVWLNYFRWSRSHFVQKPSAERARSCVVHKQCLVMGVFPIWEMLCFCSLLANYFVGNSVLIVEFVCFQTIFFLLFIQCMCMSSCYSTSNHLSLLCLTNCLWKIFFVVVSIFPNWTLFWCEHGYQHWQLLLILEVHNVYLSSDISATALLCCPSWLCLWYCNYADLC